jgi:phage repressor protein C with HTH and peptisase S24 domain
MFLKGSFRQFLRLRQAGNGGTEWIFAEMSEALEVTGETTATPTDAGPAQFEGLNSAAKGLHERIRGAVNAAGGYTAVAATKLVAGRTLSNLIAGQEPKYSQLLAIAQATGVRLEWLTSGSGPMRAEGAGFAEEPAAFAAAIPRPAPTDDVLISRYDARAAAGLVATENTSYPVEKVLFSGDFIRNKLRRKPEHLALIECAGDSMEPTLLNGDELLVDTSPTSLRVGSIYILRVGGALLAKRVQPRLDGTVLILSDNPRYPPEVITPSDATPLDVVGEVLWRSGTLR